MKKIVTRTSAGLRVLTPLLALTLLLGCDSEDNASPSQVPVIGDDDDAGSEEATDEGEDSDDTAETDDIGETDDTAEPTDDSQDTAETDDPGETDDSAEPTDDTGETDETTDDTANTGAPTDETVETSDTSETSDTGETTDDTGETDTLSSTDDPDGGSPVVPEECVENADTCVSCPTESEDFAIQCSDSECAPFDNVARLGRYVEGAPLEEVP